MIRRGYQPVYTPNIGRVELYQISGHYPYYADSQFKPIVMSDGRAVPAQADELPAPHHDLQVEAAELSRLPVRLAEFGTVYRYEQSGELGGMTRVRGFTQDDAHLFCTEEQVADEFRGCLEMTQSVLKTLGMTNYRVRLGFRDPASDKYVGRAETWQQGRGGAGSSVPRTVIPNFKIAAARPRSTAPRPTSWSPTASAANGSWAPCNSTTTCPARSVSAWNTSAPTTSRTSR